MNAPRLPGSFVTEFQLPAVTGHFPFLPIQLVAGSSVLFLSQRDYPSHYRLMARPLTKSINEGGVSVSISGPLSQLSYSVAWYA